MTFNEAILKLMSFIEVNGKEVRCKHCDYYVHMYIDEDKVQFYIYRPLQKRNSGIVSSLPIKVLLSDKWELDE